MRKQPTLGKILITLLLCTFIAVLPLLSEALSLSHHGHDCYVEHCTVCVAIRSVQSFLRMLSLLALFALALIVAARTAFTFMPEESASPRHITPITLKVRMNP